MTTITTQFTIKRKRKKNNNYGLLILENTFSYLNLEFLFKKKWSTIYKEKRQHISGKKITV